MSTAVRLERGQACATTVSAAPLFCSPRVIDYLPITVTRGYGRRDHSVPGDLRSTVEYDTACNHLLQGRAGSGICVRVSVLTGLEPKCQYQATLARLRAPLFTRLCGAFRALRGRRLIDELAEIGPRQTARDDGRWAHIEKPREHTKPY